MQHHWSLACSVQGVEIIMAKRIQKSNREIRKPKSDKPKPTTQASPFDKPLGAGSQKKGGGK